MEDQSSKAVIDQQKIATNVASRLVDRLLDGAEQRARNWWAKRKNSDRSALRGYVADQYGRYSRIKNILYDSEAVDIDSLYVGTSFSQGILTKTDQDIYSDFGEGRRIVIRATAGAGKSFFMRRMFSHLAKENTKHLPVFIELKTVNETQQSSLVGHIYKQMSIFDRNLMLEQLTSGLEEGIFAIFLDGFDEIDHDKVDLWQKHIIDFSASYPKIPIIVSSRPHDAVASWQDFSLFKILPLSKEKTTELIEKLQFYKEIKSKFISKITSGLYEQHESFLSVPLLATMMLLTFSETAEIESRLHAFYSDAFNALFFRHDAKKEAFRRRFQSGLSRESFRSLFSAFCVITYHEQAFLFREEKCLDFINRACKLQAIECDPLKFFHDLNVGVCMLAKEGSDYSFCHRSFQEYFTAIYVNNSPRDKAGKLLDALAERARFDQTLKLLSEMNIELVEYDWALNVARKLTSKYSKGDASKTSSLFLDKALRFEVALREGDKRIARIGLVRPDGYLFSTLCNLYDSPAFENVITTFFEATRSLSIPASFGKGGSDYAEVKFKDLKLDPERTGKLFEGVHKLVDFVADLPAAIEQRYSERNKRFEEILLR